MFGVPEKCCVVLPDLSGEVELTSFQLSYSCQDWTKIDLSGMILGDGGKTRTAKEMLRKFSVIELMDELQRRIKAGENTKEAK